MDIQGLIVDAHPPVAITGQPGDVAADLLLEEARRLAHGQAFGGVDPGQRHLVYAHPTLQGGQLVAPGDEALRLARNLLRIHRVGVNTGTRTRLGIAGPLQDHVPISYLSLKPFAGTSVAGQRPERVERGRLLLHLQRCPVAQIPNAAAALSGHQGGDLDLQRGDLLASRLLAGHEILGRSNVVDAKLAQDVLDTRRRHTNAFLGPDASLATQRAIPLPRLVEVADAHGGRPSLPEALECNKSRDDENGCDDEQDRR